MAQSVIRFFVPYLVFMISADRKSRQLPSGCCRDALFLSMYFHSTDQSSIEEKSNPDQTMSAYHPALSEPELALPYFRQRSLWVTHSDTHTYKGTLRWMV